MDHDWFDGNQPVRRFQLSSDAQAILVADVRPLVFGYHQAIESPSTFLALT
ncbi:MAG: hypothetical protein U0892_15015 [Pirellulales bacterium]